MLKEKQGAAEKITQIYYGIKWSQTHLPSSSNNEHVLIFLLVCQVDFL